MEKKTKVPVGDKPAIAKPTLVAFADADVSSRYNDVYQDIRPDEVADVRWRDGAYEFICKNHVTLRVQVLTPGIIRLRYTPDGTYPADFSYAIDPEFEPEKVVVRLHENPNEYLLLSEQLQVVVSKTGMGVKIYDHDDHILCEDAGGFSARRTVMQGWSKVQLEKKCHRKEVFFGLGDKTCGTNLAGKKFQNWCTDSYAYGRKDDPLYRAIPFYYSLHQGLAYGIFLDNTFRSHFDFDKAEAGSSSFWAEGGELNYYFLYGPAPADVTRAYARLTGRQPLPALWTLGYHQCRWSYYPDTEVLAIAQEFRTREIPCDAIYLDIDYMDGYRCFTWHPERFPNPKGLIDDLRARGFETVVMIDPGIKEDPDYAIYQEGMAKNMFVRSAEGDVAKAPVWPGFCAYPDFTHPEVRAWWGPLHQALYQEQGVSGFWNDMNEPAVFHVNHKTLPNSVRHDYDGQPCSHHKAHNVYGQQMARASWEGLNALQPEKRPYLLTRATYSGGQRYAAIWTGDNVADWEHLQIANIQCQRLAISGFSFCGTDIGGFTGCTDGELFVRWLQLSVFHPLMRTHSKGGHAVGDAITPIDTEIGAVHEHTDAPPVDEIIPLEDAVAPPFRQEPWSFGEKWTLLAKKAIELRYALLPCLYTAMWRAAQDGTPALQHIAFADPNDPKLWEQERDFLFGEHLLVSPVISPRVQRQGVYLPKGQWFYFWTGQPSAGEMFVNVMPDQIPFFVREGAVLPVYPIRQWVGERPVEELTLYVYYKNGRENSHLYEDAGEGYGYKNGEFSLKEWQTEGANGHFTLRQSTSGNFALPYQQAKIYLVGFPTYVTSCQVDGADFPIKEIKLRDRSLYTLVINADFQVIEWQG